VYLLLLIFLRFSLFFFSFCLKSSFLKILFFILNLPYILQKSISGSPNISFIWQVHLAFNSISVFRFVLLPCPLPHAFLLILQYLQMKGISNYYSPIPSHCLSIIYRNRTSCMLTRITRACNIPPFLVFKSAPALKGSQQKFSSRDIIK
jgi:hypothetical protein